MGDFNVGGTTYTTYFGIDFPKEYCRTFAALTYAKKWHLYKARGEVADRTHGDCLEEGISDLFKENFVMTPWSRQMIHDFAANDYYAMIGCAACGKSFAMAAIGISYWIVDPFYTSVIVCSKTLADLRTRAWSPMMTLFSSLKQNKQGFSIPGKIVNNVYAIINIKDEANPETMSMLPSIQGRALDDGRLQGTHPKWMMFVVDELGLVTDQKALLEHISNIRIGTLGFKYISAANPQPWDHPASQIYIPPRGVTVTEDTGHWNSDLGYFVRHFNGYKSPVVLDPTKKTLYPFLMSQDDINSNLKNCGGDPMHPTMWKMTVGFPLKSGSGTPPVLDPIVASNNNVTGPMPEPIAGGRRLIGRAAGVDPAWSERGDAAVYAGVRVWEQDTMPYLDFSGLVRRMPITTAGETPVTYQLRTTVQTRLIEDQGPTLSYMYVDSSGNQGLADDIDVYLGPGCGHINNSTRASDLPMRAYDNRPTKDFVKDRGTEAWMVLAAFCSAGMVKGLPQSAVDGLIQRKFAVQAKTDAAITPLRLEPKDEFCKRFKGSPNDTDACALAALAVKERMGIMPFGQVPAAMPAGMFPEAYRDEQPGIFGIFGDYDSPDFDSGGHDSFTHIQSYEAP